MKTIYAVIISGMLFFACSSAQPGNARNKEIVAVAFEKWRNGTANFFDLLDENVVWEVSGRSPVSGLYKGKADFMGRAVNPITSKFKMPLKPELVSLSADDTYVWLHFKAETTTKTNAVYENSYLWKMQLESGKIIKATAFLDTYELNQLMTKNETTMAATKE